MLAIQKGFFLALLMLAFMNFALGERSAKGTKRNKKLLPVFQIVKFPNDVCAGSSNKNGTCYTAEECSLKGGVSAGSCAEGFGVCCTFSLGCGSTSTENCTYFEVTNNKALSGECRTKVCKCQSDICQIRLDFNTFMITGPNTLTLSVNLMKAGAVFVAGTGIAQTGRCLTDSFSVTNQNTLPVICGDMTGQHVYFEASDSCNDLDFKLGDQLVGVDEAAARSWVIKITQLSCMSGNLPPTGCTQYYFGSNAGTFQSFNYGTGSNRHLAEQHQTICFRREANACRICYSADSAMDVSFGSFDNAAAMGKVKGGKCCAYGDDGISMGFDCIMIPGASKKDNGIPVPVSQCVHFSGLISASASNSKTVCTRVSPFRFDFLTDAFEKAGAAINEAASTNAGGMPVQFGFKLRYFMSDCP